MKIGTKLIIFYAASTLSVASFFAVSMYTVSLKGIDRLADAQMTRDIDIVKILFATKEIGNISAIDKNIIQKYWLRVTGKEGDTIFESEVAKELPLPEAKLSDNHTLTVYTEFINFTGNQDVILRIKRYKLENNASIIMGYPLDDDIAYSYQKTIFTFIAVLALISIFAYFLLKFILRPLGEISDVLSEINEVKLDVRLKKYSNDEIGSLASSINSLLAKLESSFEHQRSFLSIMSHELKTPLSIIKTHIEQALMDESVPMSLKRKFSGDLGQISRLDQFIVKLLLLTRLEENSLLLDLKSFNLSSMVNDISSFLTDASQSENKKLVSNIENEIFITADRVLLHRALINLCENAVKFTPHKNAVFISLKNTKNGAVLTIRDEAGGIDKETLERVENRLPLVGFFNNDKNQNGIGMRLAVMILKASDMAYEIKSEIGVGTTINIYFKTAGRE
jgi:signal transduction histidine kinase